MFFKNAIVYRFTEIPMRLTPEILEENRFKPCGRSERAQLGWVDVDSSINSLCHEVSDVVAFRACKEEKILPASVVRDLVDRKVLEIEEREDRRVYRKEKDTIRDEIIFDSLPQAFSKHTNTMGYIDYTLGLLVIDASSHTRAEEVVKLLRDSFGSLPVALLQTVQSATAVMTGWLTAEVPDKISLGQFVRLVEPGEGGATAGLDHQELISAEVDTLLASGKQVQIVEIDFDESVRLRLAYDLVLKKLKFSDAIVSESQDSSDGDRAALFDVDLALMSGVIRSLYQFMGEVFGWYEGENLS